MYKALSIVVLALSFAILANGGTFSFAICLFLGITIWPLKPSFISLFNKHHKVLIYFFLVISLLLISCIEIKFMNGKNKQMPPRDYVTTKRASL